MEQVKQYVVADGLIDLGVKGGTFVRLEDYAALQQKLDAVLAENARMLSDYREIPEMRRIGAPLTPATDAILNEVRAEALIKFAEEAERKAESFDTSARESDDFTEDQRFRYVAAMFRRFATQLRAGSNEGGV